MARAWLAALALLPAPLLAQSPAASFVLKGRSAEATPARAGFTHTGGGNIDVQQPAPDTLVVTMTGVAVAGPHPCKGSVASLVFRLEQEFEVAFAKAETKKGKLTLEGRLIGLLRSHAKGSGTVEASGACASVRCGPAALLSLCMPPRSAAGGENTSVNDRAAPVAVEVKAGTMALSAAFQVSAAHGKGLLGKAASAEFAPDPALDPLWISAFEPFRGAQKKEFGFQVTLKVSAE